MAKPVDKNDATMEVSASQVVPDKLPPKRRMGPPQNLPQNDRSVWAGSIVGTDAFAPAPAQAKPGVNRWLIIALAVVVVGAVGYLLYRNLAGPATSAPPPTEPAKPAEPPKPAVVVPPVDAAPVVVPADAALVEVPADAAGRQAIDAGTPAIVKPVVKKPIVKKPIVKKPIVKKKPVPKRR